MQLSLFIRYTLSVLGLLAVIVFNSPLSYAADAKPPDKKLSDETCGGIDCLIAGYGKETRKNFLTTLPTDSTTTTNIWLSQSDFFKNLVTDNTLSATNDAMASLFELPGTDENKNFVQTANALYAFDPIAGQICANPNPGLTAGILRTAKYASLLKNNLGNTAFMAKLKSGCNTSISSSYSNISFNTFFGPLTYTAAQKDSAKAFIQMSTLQTLPIKLVDISKALAPKDNEQAADFDTYAKSEPANTYFALLRLYATIQATAISNLQQFYDERLPLGKNAKGATADALKELNLDPNTTSQLQLENYMATRRVEDKQWYLDLAEQSPAMMDRQMLALQAEHLAETYRLRMAVERLTATMSVMLLQNSFNTRQQLDGARSKVEQAASK